MKEFKFQMDDNLWERFYRAFPGHGERSILLRKIIRNIISLKADYKAFDQVVAEQVVEDLGEGGEDYGSTS